MKPRCPLPPDVRSQPGFVTLYEVRTGAHVHYVGLTNNLRSRRNGHISAARFGAGPGERLLSGAEIVPVRQIRIEESLYEESRIITEYKQLGQCEFNKMISKKYKTKKVAAVICPHCGNDIWNTPRPVNPTTREG